jgi:hypothetical protein
VRYLNASCVRRHRAARASSRPHTHESETARALMAANAASECSLMALRLCEWGYMHKMRIQMVRDTLPNTSELNDTLFSHFLLTK